MRTVTLAMASLLSAGAMFWAAASGSSRLAADEDAGMLPAEGVGLGLSLLFALGAMCALDRPHLATATFAVAGLLGIGAGILVEVVELIALGASAALPAATSVAGSRRTT